MRITRVIVIMISFIISMIMVEALLPKLGYQPFVSPWYFVIDEKKQKTNRFYELEREKIFTLKKNTWVDDEYATDTYGFRLSHHPNTYATEKPFTIIAVGDSFTYGFGVKHHETFSAILEKLLYKKNVPAVVYNAGVSGYGPDQEYLSVLSLLTQHRPDLILWNVNLNDIEDSNQACLILPIGARVVQFPGWLNTLYLQGYIARNFPDITSKNIVNLLLYAPNRISGKDRFTPGCTNALSSDQIIKKMIFLISSARQKAMRSGGDVLPVLAINQMYLDPRIPQKNHNKQFYEHLGQVLTGIHPDTVDVSSSVKRLFQIKQEYVDLSELLFLNKREEEFDRGWRHPNALGHKAYAEALLPVVEQIFRN